MNLKLSAGNIIIEGIGLQELLQQVYDQGKMDGRNTKANNEEIITLQQLSKELAENGRNISVQTLTRKAKEAKVKVFPFDGKRNAVYKKDVCRFISGY